MGEEQTAFRCIPQLLKTLYSADSAVAGIEALYQQMHELFSLHALCVELADEEVMRFYPFGNIPETGLPSEALEANGAKAFVCSFGGKRPLRGTITWILPKETALPQEVIESLTEQIGLCVEIEHASQRLDELEESLRTRLNEMAAIHAIGQASDPAEIPRLLQNVVERTARMMEAQACSIMLLNEQKNALQLVAAHGLPEDILLKEQPLEEGLAGRVVVNGQPMLIVDSVPDPRTATLANKPEVIGSSMLHPLKNQEGQVIGVLSVRRRRPGRDFNTEDLKLFSVFAAQTALAISSMRLYTDLKSRATEMEKLSTLASVLIATTDLQELSTKLVEEICNVVGFGRCALYLRDPKKDVFLPTAWRGYPESVMRNAIRGNEGIIGVAAKVERTLLYDASRTFEGDMKTARILRGYARSLGTTAFVLAPFRNSEGECSAVLVADNRARKRPISINQLHLLNAFVGQAGIAIENARLYIAMRTNMEAARRLQAYTERLLRSIDIAILSADSHGLITRCNPAVEKVLNIPPNQCRGSSLEELITQLTFPAYEKAALKKLIAHAQVTGEIIPRQRFHLHVSSSEVKTISTHVSGLPEPGNEPYGVVLIMEDITQEIQLEREIERMRRLADIGQLAAKMAHEVRNALSPIRAGTQILQRELQKYNIAMEWPDIILAEVDDLTRLTSELLEFSRPTTLHPQTLELHSFLTTTLQTLRPYLEENNVQLAWDLPPSLPPILADPVYLQQVLRNLIQNAVEAMAGQAHPGVLEIAAQYEPESLRLVIEVRDNGEGIAYEDQERIFQPFFTTRSKGTGLGLPIVVKLVHQHGGHVEVESQRGKGACFRVVLPRVPPSAAESGAPSPSL